MATPNWLDRIERTPIGRRVVPSGGAHLLDGVTRSNALGQALAGVTLLAIAIPEQLATSQLAGVPAFTALIAFIAATLVFFCFGSNPILSVGADSTIAPLFAVALLRLALPDSTQYFALVAATAVVTGLCLIVVGVAKLGWMADFLSVPLVSGFLTGIGVIIAVHQLPKVLGVQGGGDSVLERLHNVWTQLGHVSGWSVGLALGTLAIMLVGERVNPRLPWALGAVGAGTALVAGLSLTHHGVVELGSVAVGLPQWRLHWFSLHEWSVVVTTSLTLVIVIMSQSAATARTAADELGVADDLSRDFTAIGLANVASGLLGSLPVNASPARTTVTRLAGGRTKLAMLVAGVGTLVLAPLATFAHAIPLAALAGVLLFIAGRLIKVAQLRSILHTSRAEFILALIATFGVVVLGVETGLAIAVGLAILTQTWRSARPSMIEMGRRRGTTSWEPYDAHAVERVDHLLVVLFDHELFFANAGVFRRLLHQMLKKYPKTRHLIIDAAAMSDLDYTALMMLAQVVDDLLRDKVSVSMARISPPVRAILATSSDKAIRHIKIFESVDEAAQHALKHLDI